MEKKSSYKTVLLGDSSVGKSSIVLRLTKDTFHDNTNTTIGASFCTYVVNLNTLKEHEISTEYINNVNTINTINNINTINTLDDNDTSVDINTKDINYMNKNINKNINKNNQNDTYIKNSGSNITNTNTNTNTTTTKKEKNKENNNDKNNEKNERYDENFCNIKFDIWDTAGQERYASIVPLYYRGATCAIVVFDISNLNSFDRAKTWVNQLRVSSNYIIILVANKIDKNNFRVDMLEAQKYAQENNLLFIQTSAKTGANIKNIFYILAEEIYKNIINNKNEVENNSVAKDTIDLNAEKKKKTSCC